MNTIFRILVAAITGVAALAHAQETRFTYQGELRASGAPAAGEHDFRFSLHDTPGPGTGVQLAGPVVLEDVVVADGLFTVPLDFGLSPWDGGAIYLQVEVRPGAQAGDFTVLSPRQSVTAAPYALHAVQVGDLAVGAAQLQPGAVGTAAIDAGEVQRRIQDACGAGQAMASVGSDGSVGCVAVPPGDVTSVNAGFGLSGGGSSGSVTLGADSSVLQRRISADCPAGSFLTGVNQDGSPDCAAATTLTPSPLGDAVTLVSGSAVSHEFDAVLGSHGGLLVAWYDDVDGDLEFIACLDVDCVERQHSTLDSAGITGRWPSLGVRPDGRPAIAYYDASNGNLRLVDCADALCTSYSRVTVVSSGNVGGHPAIAFNGSAVVVVYYDFGAGDLEFVACSGTPPCSSRTDLTLAAAGDVGRPLAMIDSGETFYPLWIAYRNVTEDRAEFLRCSRLGSCQAPAIIPGSTDAEHLAILLGSDNLPLLAHARGSASSHLNFRHCEDLACSTVSETSGGLSYGGGLPSIDLGLAADGMPLALAGADRVRCGDRNCSGVKLRSGLYGSAGRLVNDREGRSGIVRASTSSLGYLRCRNRVCNSNLPLE